MALSRETRNRWRKALAYAPAKVRLLKDSGVFNLVEVNGLRDFDRYVLGAVATYRNWYSQCLYIRQGKVVFVTCTCKDWTDEDGGCFRPHPWAGKFGIHKDASIKWCKHTLALSLLVLLISVGIKVMSFPTLGAAYGTVTGDNNG
jgi:hypothetical protein